jgi:hypothetical protein
MRRGGRAVGWSRAGVGGSPLQTTLSRIPLGHSGHWGGSTAQKIGAGGDPQLRFAPTWITSDQLPEGKDRTTRLVGAWTRLESVSAQSRVRVGGEGALSRGPYLLGRFSEAEKAASRGGPGGQADCDSAWSGRASPTTPRESLQKIVLEFRGANPAGSVTKLWSSRERRTPWSSSVDPNARRG